MVHLAKIEITVGVSIDEVEIRMHKVSDVGLEWVVRSLDERWLIRLACGVAVVVVYFWTCDSNHCIEIKRVSWCQ